MNIILETERLILREFGVVDIKFIIELVNTPAWLTYIGDRNVKTNEQAKGYIEIGLQKSYRENGFGLWLVETKDNGNPIGMCGLLKRDFLPNPDIGFAFLPEFMGKGFAFEAASATMNFAKEKLRLDAISAITLPENNSSISLLEKLGMSFTNKTYLSGNNEVLLIYSSEGDSSVE